MRTSINSLSLSTFTDTENNFARHLMESIGSDMAMNHADTVEYITDTAPHITTFDSDAYGMGGFYSTLSADLSLARSEDVPVSIQDNLEDELDACQSTFLEENPDSDTDSERYWDYETEWLAQSKYYYEIRLTKEFGGHLVLSVRINHDSYCRPNSNCDGNYTKWFKVSDNLTEEDIERITDSVLNTLRTIVWQW